MVKWSISQRYILVNSPVISFENIQVATAEQSTICSLSSLSISTTIICWCDDQSSKMLCNMHICASSVSARARKTTWNLEIAAKLCENDFEPRLSSVCTNTSILRALKLPSDISSPLYPLLGISFNIFTTSSGVHFCLMATTSWWATAVPGRFAKREREREMINRDSRVEWNVIKTLGWVQGGLLFSGGTVAVGIVTWLTLSLAPVALRFVRCRVEPSGNHWSAVSVRY